MSVSFLNFLQLLDMFTKFSLHRRPLLLSAAVFIGLASPASAALFRLHSHPDGGARPPLYGLRLDGLSTGNTNDIFTFDFDYGTSEMFLDYDGSTIHIYGTAYGGLNSGSGYAAPGADVGYFDIDFTYTTNVSGDIVNGLEADESDSNRGRIIGPQGDVYALEDEAGNHGYSFRFNDSGHRLGGSPPYDLVGWGWVNHAEWSTADPDDYSDFPAQSFPHVYASDWLFTGELIDEPSTVPEGGATIALPWSRVGRDPPTEKARESSAASGAAVSSRVSGLPLTLPSRAAC